MTKNYVINEPNNLNDPLMYKNGLKRTDTTECKKNKQESEYDDTVIFIKSKKGGYNKHNDKCKQYGAKKSQKTKNMRISKATEANNENNEASEDIEKTYATKVNEDNEVINFIAV